MAKELQVGEIVGPYRLEEMLGEGGMGLVFRAVRDSDGVVVALKVLKRQFAGDEQYRKRFQHEARAASEIQHAHLVPILDVGEADGRPFLAVQYVSGLTLEQKIKAEQMLTVADTVRVATEIGEGLDALHASGIVHRDVKSSNIVIAQDGSAWLTDFGLAKGPSYTVLTKAGQVMGTLDYIAPEMIRGAKANAATDIYALGCTIFECVAGGPPFASKGAFQIAMAHLNEQPADPCAERDDTPAGFGRAVLAGLAKDPYDRPKTAAAYAAILRDAAAQT